MGKVTRDDVEAAYRSGFHYGRTPEPLMLVREGDPPKYPQPDSLRGVEELTHAPTGYRRFQTVSGEGELLEDALIAERFATPRYIAQRHRLLELADPRAQLKVI